MTFSPREYATFVRGLTGDRDTDATSIAKHVIANIGDHARIVAPEWPGTMEYTPRQMADYIGRESRGQNTNMSEQLSEFGAWRDQITGVESRNGGTIRLILACIATCDRLRLPGQKTLEELIAEQFAPRRFQRRWDTAGIRRPFVWRGNMDRQRAANVMKIEFELLPPWLRHSGRFLRSEPQRQRRETKAPERLGGYYEPPEEDVL